MKIVVAILCFILTLNGFSQNIEPVIRQKGKLNLSIDPRIELLNAVQIISDYPVINRETKYSKQLLQYFEQFKGLEAPVLSQQYATAYDFVYDAPLNMVLSYNAVPELKQIYSYTDRLIERAHSTENLETYIASLRAFALKSNFSNFWNKNLDYYTQMLKLTTSELGEYDPVADLENYFNESLNSYTIILSPPLAGGYGLRMMEPSKKLNCYACVNPTSEKNNIPYFSGDALTQFVWHEFGHSFVNPLTKIHLQAIQGSALLFDPISEKMKSMAYTTWDNCVNEHIIRAIHIRLLEKLRDPVQANSQLNRELNRRFIYLKPIIECLKQFEALREEENIRFSDFYPQLVGVFDSLADSDNSDLVNPKFNGPINAVLGGSELALIYPTGLEDSLGYHDLLQYLNKLKQYKSNIKLTLPDTLALSTDLSNYDLMVYGTMNGNKFLDHYRDTFPFSFNGDTVVTNQTHYSSDIRLITCLPNPMNEHRGMMINTATSYRNITGVRHSFSEDFIVFQEIDSILQRGIYQKKGTWIY